MQTWSKYFIVDTSAKVGRALQPTDFIEMKFGRGFIDFMENGEPLFGYNAANLKLYDSVEEADKDFDKITEKVSIIHILVKQTPRRVNAPPMVQVAHATIKSK